jgi:hypothetical protein
MTAEIVIAEIATAEVGATHTECLVRSLALDFHSSQSDMASIG